jgi:hypothetical protein
LLFGGTDLYIGLTAFNGDSCRQVIKNVYQIIDSLKVFIDQGIWAFLNRSKNSIRLDNGNTLYSTSITNNSFRGMSLNTVYILRGNNYSTQFETNFHDFMVNMYSAIRRTHKDYGAPIIISRSV